MLNPTLIKETPIGMAELREELEGMEKRDKELNFRAKKTLEYLHNTTHLTKSKSEELFKKISELSVSRLKEEYVWKIIDVLPASVDELKLLLQGFPITVTNDNLKKINDVVVNFIPKKQK